MVQDVRNAQKILRKSFSWTSSESSITKNNTCTSSAPTTFWFIFLLQTIADRTFAFRANISIHLHYCGLVPSGEIHIIDRAMALVLLWRYLRQRSIGAGQIE
jgi:hypothetical protein